MSGLKIGALFAGIGGLDLGFHERGHDVLFHSEIEPTARAVLEKHFPNTNVLGDIKKIRRLPKLDVLTAGFPCQDISIAGTRKGLAGERSGLVNEIFRLIETAKPDWLVIENVLNLISLQRGAAMRSILGDIQNLGYSWAYRVVDSRGFGLPQRRLRVVIVATRTSRDPGSILFSEIKPNLLNDTVPESTSPENDYGFYWTEGKRGIGWALDSVPTIKGGSALGIPSPPAIFSGKSRQAGTITIADAERLQGFEAGWTDLGALNKIGDRWKMVGNAVSAPVSRWIAQGLELDSGFDSASLKPSPVRAALPKSGMLLNNEFVALEATTCVKYSTPIPIRLFLKDPLKPLSAKALEGYLKRAREGNKIFPSNFIGDLSSQLGTTLSEGIGNIKL